MPEKPATSTSSIWTRNLRPAPPNPLDASVDADACVVGAGLAGLTTAYELARAGKRVVVIDDGPIGQGMTAMTTAHLTAAIDDRYFEIERLRGAEGARLAAESHGAAIDAIEATVARERIACDFERVDGFLFLAPGEDPALLARELTAAARAGLAVDRVERAPLGSFETGPALRFARQGQFHPLKYVRGLARAITKRGGRIFTGSHVEEVRGGTRAFARVGRHQVHAAAVVVATNSPINDRVVIHTKQAPYMTYVIALAVAPDSVPHALVWDTADPYHYVRVHRGPRGSAGYDFLVVGGEDHRSGHAEENGERFARLEAWARERYPEAGPVRARWAGQVLETLDGLAYLGRNPLDEDNVFVATGDSGMGMTHGTIAGMLIADLVLGRHNPWAELYDPSRKTLRAAGTFTRQALDMAAQYGDWLGPGDDVAAAELAPDSGAVVRRGRHKIALYRDPDGKLHQRSAVCPHLGCIVAWNAAERSFDCPCHGSRFDRFGEVVVGPANAGLGPAPR